MNSLILENDQPIDVFHRLLSNRIIFIYDYIDDQIASEITAALLSKDLENNEPISLFINSEGGYVKDIFTIYDTFKIIKSPIRTVASGLVMNESVLLLAAGEKDMRFATKNSIIVPSQIYCESQNYSDLTDAKIMLSLLQKENENFMSALSKCCGKTSKFLLKDLREKKYMTPKDAVSYGLIDKVVGENEKTI